LIDDDDETQGGFRLELLQYDNAGNVTKTYNLTSPANGFVGASNATYAYLLPNIQLFSCFVVHLSYLGLLCPSPLGGGIISDDAV